MESISAFQSTTQGDIAELKERLIQAEVTIERLQKNIKERSFKQQPLPHGQGGQPFPVDPRFGYMPPGQPMFYGPGPGMMPAYYPYPQMPQPQYRPSQERSEDSSFQQDRQPRRTKEQKNGKQRKNTENEESKSDISSRMDRSQVTEPADNKKKAPYRHFIGLGSEKEDEEQRGSQLDSSQIEQLNEEARQNYPEFSNVEVDPEHTTVAIIREALPGYDKEHLSAKKSRSPSKGMSKFHHQYFFIRYYTLYIRYSPTGRTLLTERN